MYDLPVSWWAPIISPWSLVCTSTALPDCVLSWRTVRELVRTEGVALVA